jgi:hypothetical protein
MNYYGKEARAGIGFFRSLRASFAPASRPLLIFLVSTSLASGVSASAH